MKILKRRGKALAFAAVGVSALIVGTAFAQVATMEGGPNESLDVATNEDSSFYTAPGYQDVPGTAVVVEVPAGEQRLVDARFTAETQCFGPTAGEWCSARIVATNTTTLQQLQLHPTSGVNYAIDSVGVDEDFWEGHALERARVLNAGTWEVKAQATTTNTSTTLRLDDTSHAVQVHECPCTFAGP